MADDDETEPLSISEKLDDDETKILSTREKMIAAALASPILLAFAYIVKLIAGSA